MRFSEAVLPELGTAQPKQEADLHSLFPSTYRDLTLFMITATDHRRLDLMITYAADEIQARHLANPWLMQRSHLSEITVHPCPGGLSFHTLLFPGRMCADV